MKFSISTKLLKNALAVVNKGVGKKVIIPITEYFNIQVKGGSLAISATDGVNHITQVVRGIEGEDGAAIVKASTLTKLVNKTTKDTMTFDYQKSHLAVTGNGKYMVEVLEDEAFPEWTINSESQVAEIEASELKNALIVNKSAIAYEMLMPCLRGYYMGQRVTTTDGIKMCINETVISPEPLLLPQSLAELLLTLPDEKVKIFKDGNKLLFNSPSVSVFGAELAGIEDYPDIMPLLEIPHDAMCTLPKQELLDTLTRLSLFVNPFDNSGVLLHFTAGKLIMSDIKGNSVEELPFIEHVSGYGASVWLAVNIELFKELIEVIPSERIKIEYGEELPLKIQHEKITQIISIMELGGESNG